MREWVAPCHTKEQLDVLKKAVFPELRESEDERIRKKCIAIISKWTTKEDRDECIAYLELQKEQKPAECIEFDNEFKNQVSHLLASVLNKEWEYNKGLVEYAAQQLMEYAKHEIQSAEWSEEDEDILNCCISSIEEAKENRYAYKETDGDTSYDHEISWLKSLRPQWRPSEEQMEALLWCIAHLGGADRRVLAELYEHLKNLM